jgi:hypothetical protein
LAVTFVVLLVCLGVLVAVALAFEWPDFSVPVLSPDWLAGDPPEFS